MSESKSKPKRKRRGGPKTPDGSAQARRTSAVILEVLAGVMGPADAAEVLGVSAAQYYKVEARALEGLVKACETRPRRGRTRTVESELSQLRREHAKLGRECTRLQSLVRVLQRAAGVKPTKAKRTGKGTNKGGKAKRKRKPTVRALRLAKELRDNTRQGEQSQPETGGAGGGAGGSGGSGSGGSGSGSGSERPER